MTEKTETRCAHLAAMLARQFPLATPFRCATLIIDARKLARRARLLEERICNDAARYYDPDVQAADREKLRGFANRLLVQHFQAMPGLKLRLGGDPRGSGGSLFIPGTAQGDGSGPLEDDGTAGAWWWL